MLVFKFIFVVYFCANCVFGLYVPSNDAEVESNDKKLIDDLKTIIKNKLQPSDKGVSSLDEFHVTNNANLLTKGSSSIFNDPSARFIDFEDLIKFAHDSRNNYEHSRHFKSDHNYCDNRSSEESREDDISAFNEWVKHYNQFIARLSTEPIKTTTTTSLSEATIIVKPTTTESLTSSRAHDDDDFNEIELIRLIPSVIEHLKTNRLTQKDSSILSQIYGDVWLIMDEESKRDHKTQKINPILKLILQLKDLRKRDIDRHELMNDYRDNSVDVIRNGDHDIVDQPLRIKLGLNENLAQLSPAQRILRTIAMLIPNITRYNYIAMDQTIGHYRKNIKMRRFMPKKRVVHPNVIRLPRSSLHHNNNNSKHNNNIIENDIDLYDSDEAAFYHQRVSSFDDNPSIIELIKLAEFHRLRRQQKLNKNSISLIDKLYSATMPSSDNDEYYYDDEPESVDSLHEDDANDEEYEEDDNYDD